MTQPEFVDARAMFDYANILMEELDARFSASGEANSFAAYLRKNPADRATMKDIARIREEAHERLEKELGK